VQHGGEKRPVGGAEADLLAAQVPFEHGDLVAEGQDLRIIGAVTHG
jgi:hypothetical protein